jgi:hypothetical protein
MAYREFVDSKGVAWRVWSTVPIAGTRLRGGFDQGWLTFESTSSDETTLRRLVPIPPDWESAPDNRLELMCRSADEVVRPTPTRQSGREFEESDQA